MLTIDVTSLATLTAYAVAAASLSSILVQLIKDGIVDPRVRDGTGRTTLLRAINYVLNFALLTLILITNGAWQWSGLFLYIGLALDQSVVSHLGYKVLTRSAGGTSPAPSTPIDMTGTPQP